MTHKETHITNHSKIGRVYQNLFASNLFKSFGFENIVFYSYNGHSSEPEVQGQVNPSNCIILQLPGKFTLAHIC
jgi:hypothetical protein